eukprot:CAMPEP_0117658650 /NCGR_PEP_ID=MMETSP0804-20121206/5975_1 /TAXON_ID=1074897 /ORGANISM="Tetraselmis astigmatica, Strain CCMP880" /LENGTH=45 /DNA_ID= /DNA_START= /DNA_END= /DNA_ORIENTATION=
MKAMYGLISGAARQCTSRALSLAVNAFPPLSLLPSMLAAALNSSS